MYSNDIGKISSRTTRKKLIEISSTRGEALEKRINAINLLSVKKEVDPGSFFGKVLRDKKEDIVVKNNLVLKLGHRLKSVRTLENFLGKEYGKIDRSILQVLAYRGDAKSAEKITAYLNDNKGSSPEIRKAQFARMLISYRLNDNKATLPKSKPGAFENFRGIDSEVIKRQKLSSSKATEIINELDDAYKLVPLAVEKAQKLDCQGKTLTILLNKALVSNTFDFKKNGIVASITQDDYCPGGHFIKYHVLINKAGRSGDHWVHIINPNGQVLMEGPAIKRKDDFSFQVKALKRAGSTPVLFDATFDLNTTEINVKEARSGIGLRKSSVIQLSSRYKD
ncbi:hypothetical protein C5O00_12695 [Pukyongia salina]|uniref:Uncharacterized protein n=1 Tax=Pukyongia salina TaxID=2094025 RepID=A0A2S0HZG6_9FLAO|nr:hypothetical protein [Pukyongia salina]AVI51964.1 hypothetical protein C5O00_12695 [Pukyongia salina]